MSIIRQCVPVPVPNPSLNLRSMESNKLLKWLKMVQKQSVKTHLHCELRSQVSSCWRGCPHAVGGWCPLSSSLAVSLAQTLRARALTGHQFVALGHVQRVFINMNISLMWSVLRVSSLMWVQKSLNVSEDKTNKGERFWTSCPSKPLDKCRFVWWCRAAIVQWSFPAWLIINKSIKLYFSSSFQTNTIKVFEKDGDNKRRIVKTREYEDSKTLSVKQIIIIRYWLTISKCFHTLRDWSYNLL